MDSFSGYSRGVLVAVFFLVAVPVIPALALAPPVTPIGLRHVVKSGSVLNGKVSYQIGLGSASTYVEKSLAFGGLTMGKLALGFLKGGVANLALMGLIQGIGWVWDEANQDVRSGDKPPQTCSNYYSNSFNSIKTCSVMDAIALSQPAFEAHVCQPSDCRNFVWSGTTVIGGDSKRDLDYELTQDGGDTWEPRSTFIRIFYVTGDGPVTSPVVPGSPVTDLQLGEQVIQNGDPVLWEQLLTDPVTGQPVTTPEIQAQRWEIQKDQAEQAGEDPTTVPEPVQTGGTDTATSEPEPETDMPAFCTWAKSACDFYTWVMGDPVEPEKVPLPLTDVPQPDGWDSGIASSGVCPSPTSITIWSDNTIEIPWQPACDGADIMRPFLLAMAYLIAAGILIGRKGGAT